MGRACTPHSYMAATKSWLRILDRPRKSRQMESVTSPQKLRKSPTVGGRLRAASPRPDKNVASLFLRAAPSCAGTAKAMCSRRSSPSGRARSTSSLRARAALTICTRKTSRLVSHRPRPSASRRNSRTRWSAMPARAASASSGHGSSIFQRPPTLTSQSGP